MATEFQDLVITRSNEVDFDIALRHLDRAIEHMDFEGPDIAAAYADSARKALQAATGSKANQAIAGYSSLTGPVEVLRELVTDAAN